MASKSKSKSNENDILNRYKDKKANLCFKEVEGDLFDVANNVSLAHCVSSDFAMGAGIAAEFKKQFKGTGDLIAQGKDVGECAYLQRGDRYVFYLVTKKVYNHKPTYMTIEKCLKDLCELCKKFKIEQLAMPRIGSGLDNLDWYYVSRIIDDLFKETNIQITVYYLK